jgi:AbrB family looped-hinge helix DNA binding protein
MSKTSTSVTSKGQVTIPVEVRQKLGIRQGSQIGFRVRGSVVEMTVVQPTKVENIVSGFGLLTSKRRSILPAFDPAKLLSK